MTRNVQDLWCVKYRLLEGLFGSDTGLELDLVARVNQCLLDHPLLFFEIQWWRRIRAKLLSIQIEVLQNIRRSVQKNHFNGACLLLDGLVLNFSDHTTYALV